MINQFGLDPKFNFDEFEKIRTIDNSVFIDHDQINWENISTLKSIKKTVYSSDDTNRIDFCDFAKAVTGDYLPNTPQQDGDCVAASFEVASEHLNCIEIYNGELQVFHQHFRPWLYGIGRVYIGKNQIRGAGSVTSWQVQGAAKYGVLREGLEGLPRYSASISKLWGSSRSTLDPWKNYAKDFTVQKSITIKNFDQLCDAMIIGKMPVVIASNQGFRMSLKVDKQSGKSWFVPSGSWGHQMSVGAAEKTGRYPGARIHNQWGLNAHPGQLDGPDGTGWVTPEFFNKWVRQTNCVCVAIGNFNAWKWNLDDISVSPFK